LKIAWICSGERNPTGLQYPGASIPKESNLYVEVSSFCKALLKKSTSTVLSASNRFSFIGLPTKSAFAGILFRYCPFNFSIRWLQSVSCTRAGPLAQRVMNNIAIRGCVRRAGYTGSVPEFEAAC
jgi:hypothetical protein